MKLIYFSFLIVLLTSCWPKSISFQDGSMPDEWKVFIVKTLELTAPNAPISYSTQLTEKIKEEVQNRSKLTLSPNPKKIIPQISIEGNITNYTITPIAIQPGDNAAKNRLTITVDFTIFITKPKEDKMILTSSRFADYDSSSDLSSIENQLLDEINKLIVQDLINKLFSNW